MNAFAYEIVFVVLLDALYCPVQPQQSCNPLLYRIHVLPFDAIPSAFSPPSSVRGPVRPPPRYADSFLIPTVKPLLSLLLEADDYGDIHTRLEVVVERYMCAVHVQVLGVFSALAQDAA